MCMGIFIVAAGFFFSVVLAYLQIPQSLLASVAAWTLSPLQLILLLMLFYLALGLILDGTSTIIMTLPVVLPLVTGAGFDLIWFGIFLILVVEMAQITPPVGFNLFVIQSLTGESVGRIARYAFPFFLVTLAMTLLVVFFPEIATFSSQQDARLGANAAGGEGNGLGRGDDVGEGDPFVRRRPFVVNTDITRAILQRRNARRGQKVPVADIAQPQSAPQRGWAAGCKPVPFGEGP